MRLLMVGPPGAGKGTQAARLAAHYVVPTISTGDIFRAHMAQETVLGRRVKEIYEAGGYVSDDITNTMVRGRLAEPDARDGFLLDGYPRTRAQVDELDAILAESGVGLDAVVLLHVDPNEIIARLVRRAETDGRIDDTEEVIRHRQEIYLKETAPLTDVYRDRGLLVKIDGLGDLDDVTQRLVAAINRTVATRPNA